MLTRRDVLQKCVALGSIVIASQVSPEVLLVAFEDRDLMRPNILSLAVLCCIPISVLAQSARQEIAINLPIQVFCGIRIFSPGADLIARVPESVRDAPISAQCSHQCAMLPHRGGSRLNGDQKSHIGLKTERVKLS
jgi:hypothetical protein